MTLAKRQLAQVRAQLERDLRRKDKERLASLRTQIRTLRAQHRERMRAVKAECREARVRNRARAKRARERLKESIRRTREQARTVCQLAVGEAQAKKVRDIGRAVDELAREQGEQRKLLAWTRPKPTNTATPRERAQESDDVVLANIDEPGLRIVFEHVKRRIKAGPRRSRTEAFYEWVAEHPSEVFEIQEADAARELERLEREERRLHGEMRKAGRYKGSPEVLRKRLADVPF